LVLYENHRPRLESRCATRDAESEVVLPRRIRKSKHDFRRDNDAIAANLELNVRQALNTDTTLTRERRFKFSRKARAYVRAYYELSCGLAPKALDHSEIERVAKVQKTHRYDPRSTW